MLGKTHGRKCGRLSDVVWRSGERHATAEAQRYFSDRSILHILLLSAHQQVGSEKS